MKINSRSETVEQMSLGGREFVVAVGGMRVRHGGYYCGGLQFPTMVGLCVYLEGSFYGYTRKLFYLVTFLYAFWWFFFLIPYTPPPHTFFFFFVLIVEFLSLGLSSMLDKHSSTELHPLPSVLVSLMWGENTHSQEKLFKTWYHGVM